MASVGNLSVLDIDELALTARELRSEADRLLRHTQLVDQLGRYGDVEVTGSYRWDLMLRPEIDFYVVNPAVDLDLGLEALQHFARAGEFLRLAFIDSVRAMPSWADAGSYPAGYFIGMAGDHFGREWKVEFWLLREPVPEPGWLAQPLPGNVRRAILGLKGLCRTGDLRVSSFDIYRAVLLGGATGPEEVTAWLAEN